MDKTSAPNPTQFKCPRITIPEDVNICKYGWLQFSLTTSDGGVIACRNWIGGIACVGKFEALAAAGLMLAEWAPGFPGNNKTCQRVAFDEEKPRLILCGKGSQRLKIPHISIMKKSRITFEVVIPTTEAQDAWIKAKEKELKQEMDLKKAAAVAPPVVPEKLKTAEDAHFNCRAEVRCISRFIEEHFKGTGHAYSYNSMNRIKGSLDALLNAVTNAQIVRLVPKYPRVGNVIQFPQISR